MFPMLLSRQQLRLAAQVYCQVHNLPYTFIPDVEWHTLNAGLVILAN
jgi:hypothetical protein